MMKQRKELMTHRYYNSYKYTVQKENEEHRAFSEMATHYIFSAVQK